MMYENTPEQIAGILQHEKERKERCEIILLKYSKPKEQKVKLPPIEGKKKTKKQNKITQTKLF